MSELQEALDAGTVAGSQQVRTGMGTMLGPVAAVLAAPEATWNPAESGSGATAIPFLRSPRLFPLAILLLACIPALVLLVLLGHGNRVDAPPAPKQEGRNVVIPPPPPPAAVPYQPPAPTPVVVAPPVVPARPVPVTDPPRAPAVDDPVDLLVRQEASGEIVIGALYATMVDNRARIQGRGGPHPNIGSWNDKTGYVAWRVLVTRPGRFRVSLEYACAPTGAGATYHLKLGSTSLTGVMQSTTSWDVYEDVPLAEAAINETGEIPVTITSGNRTGSALMKLRTIRLTPLP